MANFCKCGSIIINNKCSNKNCDIKPEPSQLEPVKKESNSKKKAPSKSSSTPNKTAAPSSKRKSSKCVTYKLSDFLEKQKGEE